MNELDARVESFLKDIGEVCRKHGIGINGCGCCGSPFLTGEIIGNEDYGHLCATEWGECFILYTPRNEKGLSLNSKSYPIETGGRTQ